MSLAVLMAWIEDLALSRFVLLIWRVDVLVHTLFLCPLCKISYDLVCFMLECFRVCAPLFNISLSCSPFFIFYLGFSTYDLVECFFPLGRSDFIEQDKCQFLFDAPKRPSMEFFIPKSITFCPFHYDVDIHQAFCNNLD